MTDNVVARFATYAATLGRGPGRSRALTRVEAADAMRVMLAGEAERNPAKPVAAHLWDLDAGRSEVVLPALAEAASGPEPDIGTVWRREARDPAIEARIVATIALGLLALRQGADAEAQIVWESRRAVR